MSVWMVAAQCRSTTLPFMWNLPGSCNWNPFLFRIILLLSAELRKRSNRWHCTPQLMSPADSEREREIPKLRLSSSQNADTMSTGNVWYFDRTVLSFELSDSDIRSRLCYRTQRRITACQNVASKQYARTVETVYCDVFFCRTILRSAIDRFAEIRDKNVVA